MTALTRAVLMQALANYAWKKAGTRPSEELKTATDEDAQHHHEAQRLFTKVSMIDPDVLPVPDGEQMDTMLGRYYKKYGVDAVRLSAEMVLLTNEPEDGPEKRKARILIRHMQAASDEMMAAA